MSEKLEEIIQFGHLFDYHIISLYQEVIDAIVERILDNFLIYD